MSPDKSTSELEDNRKGTGKKAPRRGGDEMSRGPLGRV